MRVDRRSSLLLECVSVESGARRRQMLHHPPVALSVTVCRCRLKTSFESSTRPRERTAVAQGTKAS